MPGLIEAPAQIWLAVAPVDLRRGIDGLSSIVQQVLGHAPCAGAAFVFRNRAGNRLKLLLWDGNGVWLCQRRLHRGHFIWPRAHDACFSITCSATITLSGRIASPNNQTTGSAPIPHQTQFQFQYYPAF
jgi:transposase